MNVNLVIKSAAQTVDDFDLQCELTWTIGQIKEKISELYPTKPKKENQKLIYGGKLLPNHLSLKSILNHSQERHILHLVCPSPEIIDAPKEPIQATQTQSFSVPPANAAFPPLNQPIFNNQGLSSISSVNTVPVVPGDALQQYLAVQQMYAQFMTQYMSQYNGGIPPVIPYSPFSTIPPVQTREAPAPQQNVPPNPPPRREQEEIHAYLDYVSILIRAVMLFAALFYYSSLSRVLTVVGIFLLISLYVKLNRQNQQEQQQQAQRQRTEELREPVSVQPENQETTPSAPTTEEANLSQQTEGRSFTSIVSLTVSLISSFFTSLIPTDPVPVNVN